MYNASAMIEINLIKKLL